MQTLCLYIDRWHLLGAVCTEQMVRPLEDKYWLYFYENGETERVEYGRNFEINFLNKAEGYIGDVFSLIADPRETFSQYGHTIEMSKIFAASGLLADLADEVGTTGVIETYISFASEVPIEAQLLFIKAMEEHRFSVKEKVAKIEHLLLEHAYRKEEIEDDGHYLVLNATTNDLRYTVYLKEGGLFAEERSEVLRGLGRDARGRALVEAVVEQMNAKLGMLLNDEEKERERIRLSRLYLDSWLIRVARTSDNMPVTFSNVSFSTAPNNRQNVMVMVRDVSKRTRSIVAEIVQEVAKFAGGLVRLDLQGILFLGDVFSNNTFVDEVLSRFTIERSRITKYLSSSIPSIVSTYSYIDCTQFSAENSRFDTQSEAERQRVLNAVAEEERQRMATEAIERGRREEDEKRNREKGYREAMSRIEDFERKGDYAQMKEWCEVALKVKPNDDEAQRKLDDAIRLLSEEKLRHEQYNQALRRAEESIENERYQDAVSQCEVALAAMPDSVEAKRILALAKGKIDTSAQIDRLIDRTDLFLGQKLYVEALNEVSKILAIDPSNEAANGKKADIEKILSEKEFHINELVKQLQEATTANDYTTAKSVLNQLIVEDNTNQLKWSRRLQEVKQEELATAERAEKAALLKNKIELAVFDDKWKEVIILCQTYLELASDSAVENTLKRAEEKVAKEEEKIARLKEQEMFESEIDDIKALIAEGSLDDARKKISELKKTYPHRNDLFKPLYKAIFDAEDTATTSKTKERKPIGFGNRNVQSDFFEEDASSTRKTIHSKPNTTASKPKRTGDSFFDMDTPQNKKENKTNTDFNF